VLHVPPIPSLYDLITLITSGEEQTTYYERFVNKKNRELSVVKDKWKGLEDLCEIDWSEVSQHSVMIAETSDGSAAKQQQLGYCLQVELGPAPRNLPQLTLRGGQCAAKRRRGTKSDVSANGNPKINAQVTMSLIRI
jgi:hypothetical protein